MTLLHALYFPATSIATRELRRESFFFDRIFHYLPAEEEKPSDPDVQLGLCEGYPPVPFQEDLARFRQLISELKGNEAEFYRGQLAALAEQPKSPDEQSVKSILRAMGGKAATDAAQSRPAGWEELWQARLVLRLAEILSREQQELSQELAAIADQEKTLFEVLKGEPEIPFSLAGFSQGLDQPPVRPEIVVKAWARLFLADSRWKAGCPVLLGSQPEAVEMVFEASEALSGKRPTRLCRVPLPSVGALEGEAFLRERAAFRAKAKETLSGFAALLTTTAAHGLSSEGLKDFTALAAAWTRILAATGLTPGGMAGEVQPHLEVYLVSESPARLFARISRAADVSRLNPDGARALIALTTTRAITCKG